MTYDKHPRIDIIFEVKQKETGARTFFQSDTGKETTRLEAFGLAPWYATLDVLRGGAMLATAHATTIGTHVATDVFESITNENLLTNLVEGLGRKYTQDPILVDNPIFQLDDIVSIDLASWYIDYSSINRDIVYISFAEMVKNITE